MFVLILSGCGDSTGASGPATADATGSTGQPTRLISLPDDEGPHVAGIEWWYFNGHLTDQEEREYSFHFVTFQRSSDGGQAGQLLQLSWGDHTEDLFLTDEKANILFSGSEITPGSFSVQTAGWQMTGNGQQYTLAFDTGAYFVELQAASIKEAVLHGGTGLVNLGPAGDTFYYTRPRLKLSGTVTVDGQLRQVSGQAWMDHQWGEFSDRQVGWDWMSLQFDAGSELMAVLVWDSSDRKPYASHGTFISSDGSARHLNDGAISLTPTGSWTSPATGTVYPMGWDLRIDSLELELELTPAQKQAELPHSRYGPPSYWEGAISLKGKMAGTSVAGKGFVELVGYGDR